MLDKDFNEYVDILDEDKIHDMALLRVVKTAHGGETPSGEVSATSCNITMCIILSLNLSNLIESCKSKDIHLCLLITSCCDIYSKETSLLYSTCPLYQ